ncbi:hypothetical protein SAMN05421819_1462 [Bryocella elongata]|uniref:Uncharacterized protein n=2 Tax=Bryocella elongata TaxID=863522 RepID=A0A1H5W717_9BACT|nr:hypothetical protein SAMN05421819_1462 [Bryocella elongata]
MVAPAQHLTPDKQKIVEAARAHYYSLPDHGFDGLSCSVSFDWSTFPWGGSSPEQQANLKQTKFLVTIDGQGRSQVTAQPPDGPATVQPQGAAGLARALVAGVFLTWPTKGLFGPIPPFNTEVGDAAAVPEGFRFTLAVPGGPVTVITDKDYLASEVRSFHDEVDEHPVYSAMPEGLVYTANQAVTKNPDGTQSEIAFELNTQVLSGLRVPSSVHLRINRSIDVHYSLENCAVKKTAVVKVLPPK